MPAMSRSNVVEDKMSCAGGKKKEVRGRIK